MALITLSGPVNTVKEDNFSTPYNIRFRIDTRPVVTYMKVNLTDGDAVSVVADDTIQGEPKVIALRNHKTKVTYTPPEMEPKLSIGGIILGILLIPCIGVGLFIIWMQWDNYQGQFKLRDHAREVKRLLDAAG